MKIITTLLLTIAAIFSLSTSAQTMDLAGMMANKIDASTIPDVYNFSFKYSMEIQSEGKTMNAEYLLEKDAPFFGMRMSQSGNEMTMIMDTKNKITVGTIGKGAQKMAMASKIPEYSGDKQNNDKKFTFKSLPEKTILGYRCKGVEATDADNTIVFYYTNEAPVNFSDMFKAPQAQKMPDAFKSYFKAGEKPLMLSVDMTDKSNGKKTSLKCTSLEKETFTFKKADYKFL